MPCLSESRAQEYETIYNSIFCKTTDYSIPKHLNDDPEQFQNLEQLRLSLLSGFVFRMGGGNEHKGITFGFSAPLVWNEAADLFEYGFLKKRLVVGE